jgi:hypothetical protein
MNEQHDAEQYNWAFDSLLSDEKKVFELEQFIDDISTNNADKHIVGYYEDKVGTYKNIEFSDGPSGQGSF